MNARLILSLIVSILIISLAGCKQEVITATNLPQNVDQLKALQRASRTKIAQEKALLHSMDSMMAILDPTSVEISYKLVTTDTIEARNWSRYVSMQGNVSADDEVMVSSDMGGRIIRLAVDEGDRVARGAFIASIDMETVRRQRDEITTQLSLAKDVYEKQSRLWNQKIGTEIQYLNAKNTVERLEKSLATIDETLKKSKIYAPISGVVEQVFSETGEIAGPGTPIIKILNSRKLVVNAELPEDMIRHVRRGKRIQVSIPALEREEDLPITYVSPTVNPANRSFGVEVAIRNRDGLLKPNMLAELRIPEEEVADAIVLPTDIVQHEVGGKSYIYLVSRDGDVLTAEKRYVLTGDNYDNEILIVGGVEAGEQIIVEGFSSVNHGDPIELLTK